MNNSNKKEYIIISGRSGNGLLKFLFSFLKEYFFLFLIIIVILCAVIYFRLPPKYSMLLLIPSISLFPLVLKVYDIKKDYLKNTFNLLLSDNGITVKWPLIQKNSIYIPYSDIKEISVIKFYDDQYDDLSENNKYFNCISFWTTDACNPYNFYIRHAVPSKEVVWFEITEESIAQAMEILPDKLNNKLSYLIYGLKSD